MAALASALRTAAAASVRGPRLACGARRPMRCGRPAVAPPASRVAGLSTHTRAHAVQVRASTTAAAGGGGAPPSNKKARLVFLGTPPPAASVLATLLDAADAPGAAFEVAAVVSQPAKRQGRGRRAAPPSAVAALALSRGFAAGGEGVVGDGSGKPPPPLLTPSSASDPAFLSALASLQPDLCVTAAYGLILPPAFLRTPRVGTLNLHPSLLPRWRGAAPVPRALQAGDATTGVCVAWTVSALDAGPILAVEEVVVPPDATAPALLEELMGRGARLLLANLSTALSFPDADAAMAAATPQDATGRTPTHAARLSKAEACLDFGPGGGGLGGVWNAWRAFAGWPVAWAAVVVGNTDGSLPSDTSAWVPLKILEARPVPGADGAPSAGGPVRVATPRGGPLLFPCAGGGALAATRVQAPGGKPLAAGDYVNGLAGRGLWVVGPPPPVEEEEKGGGGGAPAA
jgi:methionyl-tRNA formyltransferase